MLRDSEWSMVDDGRCLRILSKIQVGMLLVATLNLILHAWLVGHRPQSKDLE